jgi:ribosomal protein S18 acetylase RimI-like enzyme
MTEVTPAYLTDIPALSQLLQLLFSQEADFRPNPARQIRGLTQIIESPAMGQILVARDQGQVIGMVSLLYTISTAEGGPVAWLEDMIVDTTRRGAGIGNELLAAALTHAKQRGLSRITLLTDATNHAAQRFYKQSGFQKSEMIVMRQHVTPNH